jgi:Sad1 / UNC-like C-terminal
MKRRRISLLLMGVLPLLAKDDIPSQDDEENELRPMRNAAETMHNDVLTSLPRLQLIDLSSNANSVLTDYSFDINLDMEDGERSLNDTDSYIHHHLEHGDAVSKQHAFNSSQLHSTEPRADISAPIGTGVEISEDEKKDLEDLIETQDIAQEEGDDTIMESNPEPKIDVGEEEEEAAAKRVMVDYANKSAGALILERSPSMKGASNLLTSDRDKYAIAPCKDKKFVVVGLSEDILVKQIKVANYELYSSHVKDFQVLGSQTMGQWVDLGTFTANQGNGEQSFDLSEPSWARYLKFRFISFLYLESNSSPWINDAPRLP